ncbi:chitin synthase-domain-containing protein [Absidia repens]|uniref:chitin synthase n=1 Tax=Absidia repens TaxID=90262 RepID=A0A1X2IP54_9FUNG|nr:chitin synthase-domain-containing protein [Absidia repens]
MQDETRTDLTSLPHESNKGPSEDAILHLLQSRFKHGLPYTRLGHSILIAVNPYQPLDLLNDATLQSYADVCYRDLSESKPIMQPHVYDLAAKVYFHMRRTGQDQSIILSGITGSGKSTTRAHLLEQILLLSTHTKKERKLQQQIRQSSVILEAFGHARTSQNKSASQFGQFQEIQLNERGHLVGAQSLTFAFDKYRLLATRRGRLGERTYHVFYSLLAGTTPEEKTALYINFDLDHFYYLNNQHLTTEDEVHFGDLKTALKTCGFKASMVTAMFQLLSAILHMGNLQFTEPEDSMVQDACAVKNVDVLQAVAALLGVSPHKLETALTYKLRLIRNELCTVFLNPRAAEEQRDAFACALYHSLFVWIVENLNTKLCHGDPANFIGLMDLPGFQNFSKTDDNGFEQFCFNFANERLHQFMIQQQFNDDNSEALQDGLLLPKVLTMDNIGCLDLLGGNNGNNGGTSGLVGAVNKASAKYQTGATDATDANLLATMQRQYNGHPSFISAQSFSFGIHHYGGTVHYSVDHFLDRNMDSMSPDFVSLLRDHSSNNFVSSLFQSMAMATESHPKDDRTIVKAQLTSKPTRAPSMRRKTTKRLQRKNTTKQTPAIPEESEAADITTPTTAAEDTPDAYLDEEIKVSTVLDQLYTTLSDLFVTMAGTQIYNVIHIRPNDMQAPDTLDSNRVKNQLRSFLLSDLTLRRSKEYVINYTYGEFVTRYEMLMARMVDTTTNRPERELTESLYAFMNWNDQNAFLGRELIWLAYGPWKELEDGLRLAEKDARAKSKGGLDASSEMAAGAVAGAALGAAAGGAGMGDDGMQEMRSLPLSDNNNPMYDGGHAPPAFGEQGPNYSGHDDSYLLAPPHMTGTASMYGGSYAASEDGNRRDDMASQWGDESEWGINGLGEGFGPNMDMAKMVEDYQSPQIENIEEVPITALRIWWVRFVWLMTWWVPSALLSWIGKMKREDVRMAWREKFTLCLLIFLFSGVVLFFIVGLGYVMCPGTDTMYSAANVAAHSTSTDMWVSVRGSAYDITNFALSNHGTAAYPANTDTMMEVAGLDLSNTFPIPLTTGCAGLVTSDTITIQPNSSLVLGPFVHKSGAQAVDPTLKAMTDPNWYTNTFLPNMKMYKKGPLVIPITQLEDDHKSWGRSVLAVNGKVYDITDYLSTANYYGTANPSYHFLDSAVEQIFQYFSGTDATDNWNKYFGNLSPEAQAQNMNCLNNMFYLGDVDIRDTPKCQFSNYLLLAFACLMCLTIVVKFISALQFGGAPTPEEHDKFVICQVPCYTEDEESIRKTIDSLTVLNYDDRRKLILIIADGMIMGSGNDRPTPRIVLDVLGYDTTQDPEALMFKSIGDGSKQLNYGKIYSGLYECEGHVVPYLVVAKVGKASERAKPGNRGKRDSQMILMNFLSKVHFDSPMTPMELEMYHQIKNVIGVHPSFYEYVLMIDSDTEVEPNALNHMISTMLHDGKIIGLCGETKLSNEDQSWTTMIQVYEYYISHHLSKAFESLFGSVTCLPGCFCMYRIRTPVKNEPLIISPKIINEYKDNHVDTLHKKNLLHLGEDRYLTTLMMKHFPNYKMKFTPYAICQTVAPDKWAILLSQRRRWINSTIHNLLEVVLLPDLCGFCCFSMRFVVLLDLIGTLTLPVTACYLVYLIYIIASGNGPFPLIAICMLAGVYALQAILFILKRQWQHIGWMVFYILAIPVFSFFLPVYSFWHFDDFSWGNTRVVVGDNKQKKIIVTDDEKFDEKMIPLKKWSVYEQELWELGSGGGGDQDNKSYYSGSKRGGGSVYGGGGSQYGGGGSQYGGAGNDYGYDYYRDTKVNEKQSRAQTPSYMPSYAGSVIGAPPPMPGSEFGGPQDYMMMQPHQSFVPPHGPGSVHSFGGDQHMDFEQQSMSGRNSPHLGGGGHPMAAAAAMSQYSMPMSTASFVPPGFPSDNEIFEAIKHILSSADLMTITKKQVRTQLATQFGFDMTIKKDFINSSIESILQGRM